MKFDIALTCTFGLESVLKKELINLGYEISAVTDGAVHTKGGLTDIAVLNICLRTCNRVLIQMGEYKAENFDELFDNTKRVEWEKILNKDSKFYVSKISCVKSNIMSKTDSQRIIKKAIVDRLKSKYKIKALDENGAEYQIYVKIKKDTVSIFLNTSGESLHKRGYRLNQNEAPLKETLAAGIILLSGYDGYRQFADIMCGSGTIITEAAMIAANIAPCLNRNFAFEQWEVFNKIKMDNIRAEIKSKQNNDEIRLLGSDIDEKALRAARSNAQNAGVEHITAFQKLDFREFRSKKKGGILILNPPYGERMAKGETEQLYKDLRNVYESLDSWRMFVLCGNEEFERACGKKANKNRKLYNGNLLTYLYQYF